MKWKQLRNVELPFPWFTVAFQRHEMMEADESVRLRLPIGGSLGLGSPSTDVSPTLVRKFLSAIQKSTTYYTIVAMVLDRLLGLPDGMRMISN